MEIAVIVPCGYPFGSEASVKSISAGASLTLRQNGSSGRC